MVVLTRQTTGCLNIRYHVTPLQAEFVRCNEAYEVLSDARKRREYDEELAMVRLN